MKGTKELLTVLIKQRLVADYGRLTRDAFVAQHREEYNKWLGSEAATQVFASIDKSLKEANDDKHLNDLKKVAGEDIVKQSLESWDEMMRIVKNAVIMDMMIEPDEAKRLIDRLK